MDKEQNEVRTKIALSVKDGCEGVRVGDTGLTDMGGWMTEPARGLSVQESL